MSAKRLYLHTGLPKTGTTSIQRYFADNAEALLRLYGLYYIYGYNNTPELHIRRADNNCGWLLPLTGEGTNFLREKAREAAQHHYTSLLISDETMCRSGFKLLIAAISALQDIFPGHEIRIILYIRRADDWCKSAYAHLSKQHREIYNLRSFAAFHDDPQFGLAQGFFALPEAIRALTGIVGKENLILRVYDRKSMKNGSSLDDFADIFGIDIPLGIPEEKLSGEQNPSLPAEAVPYLAPLADSNSPLAYGLRAELLKLVKTSFEQSCNFQIQDRMDPAKIAETIDELDALVPGYKKLYEKREFSLDWPELRMNPALVAMSEVLYHLTDRVHSLQESQRKQQEQLQELLGGMRALLETHSTQKSLLLRQQAASLAGKEVYFWGCGATYQKYRHLFAEAKPRCILVDLPGVPQSVDGILVKHPTELSCPLRALEKLPLVVFTRARYCAIIAEKLYGQYSFLLEREPVWVVEH